MTRRGTRRSGAWALGLGLALTGPSHATAQQAQPLTKTELVRFLSGGVYATDELATLVRRSCLSFDPTERDREDLRSLGAGEPVMAAIEWCASPLDVSVEPAGLTLRAGQTGSVTLGASRDGRPVAGVGLTLGAGQGAAVSGVTDERGRVRLPVPASGRVRSYRLPVRGTGAPVSGDPAVAVRVVAGPPSAASLSPPSVVLGPGADTAATVRAALRDAYGNPVQGVPVSLTDPRTGFGVSTGRTETGGEAELRIASGAVVENGLLELRSEGRVLGELVVRVLSGAGEGDAAIGVAPDAAEAEPTADEEEDAPVAPETDRPEDPLEGARGEPEPGAGEVAETDSPPPDADALEEARALADRGEIDRAVALVRTAIEREPRGVAPRLELARLLDRANRLAEARAAYEEVAALAPGNVEASRGLARLRRESVRVDARVSGGATFEGSPALRGASAKVRPLRYLRVWGRYDRSFGLDDVPLIRGPDEIEGYFGGVALSWGADRLFTTSVEVGRRIDDVTPAGSTTGSLDQNTVSVEQRALVPAGRGYAAVSAGGWLGRWFDRDDWLAWARVRVPLGERLSIAPAVFTGETVGTDAGERGRAPERETRVELPIRVGSPGVWFVEPAGAVGWVSPLDDGPTERLYEARLHAEVTVTEGVAVLVFGRHHRAPGTEPFTLATLGLRLRFR